MRITVTGKQLDVGAALTEHIEARLEGSVKKYISHTIEGDVTMTKNAHLFRADCKIHIGHGIYLQSSAEETEIYAAFDSAADKLETRLRRYKRRITNHHKERNSKEDLNAVYKAQYNVFNVSEEPANEDEDSQPVIIAEMNMDIPEATVSDAVMRLDLGDLPTLMFRNSGHGGINVVYRRPDGNIGWIDPKTS
ncbi:MAG: ribosome-associated translation inhibitor RaiA [Emcibacteraceae bacterium]|nr:ribosome-associated translation inhibitor RaiA [Emcibacteraceae bacterium]MDG1857652.1 ribosome-associated translation inhibitor RaiA [Emcibacteraceae bacterium]